MAQVGICGALLYTGACWMYGWLRAADKNSPSRATFYSLTISVFEKLEKHSHRRNRARYFYFFFRIGDSQQCGAHNNVQPYTGYRAPCTVTRTAFVGGKRHLRLRFVLPLFSPQKSVPHLTFWLLWVCVCCCWHLSPPHGHDLANSLRYICSVLVQLQR